MHKIETFALNCGAKIGTPYIYTTFFPLPVEKYITFHSDSKYNSKNYSYWQDVINILTPALKQNGIDIIQIGKATDRQFSNCASIKGNTDLSQLAFVIQNSLLHFGVESLPISMASSRGTLNTPASAATGKTPSRCWRSAPMPLSMPSRLRACAAAAAPAFPPA